MGNKRRQIASDGTNVKTNNFIDNFVYANDVPACHNFDEGCVIYNSTGTYFAETYLKDRLGNIRVAFGGAADAISSSIRQVNANYPFGMIQEGLNYYETAQNSPNQYLYNGKELQADFNLDWYDYGARFYDPMLGRWHTPDPLAEKYFSTSPYCYVSNNPLKFIDPNGKDGELAIDGNKLIVKTTLNYSQESLDRYNSSMGEFTQEQFQNDFKNYYEAANGQYEIDGQKYDVSFDVSFNVVSKDADMPSANAKDGTTNLTFNADLNKAGEHSGNLITIGNSPQGMAGAQDTGGTLSHEIIHGLGVTDTHEKEFGKLSSYSPKRNLQQSEVSQMLLPAIQFSKENNITQGSVLITHSRGRDTQGNLIPREKPICLK